MRVSLKSISGLFRGLVRDVFEGPKDAEPPPEIDGYSITGPIGQGGMGAVYLAKDTTLDSEVAIKFVAGFDDADDGVRRRFLREAKAMAAVRHPNIVHVYGFGETEGRPYIVMEYVEGESLAERIKENGPLAIDEALWVLHQTIRALAAAWEKGLVHRDIKPANLLIDEKEWLRVCDFGLAKPAIVDLSAATTQSGGVVGTPHYMSPEQATGKELDYRSDIYSLGIVLYEMLIGRPPFSADSPELMIAQHLNEPLPDVRTTGRSKRWGKLATLIAWMTEKDPEHRPATYEELLEHVDDLVEDPSVSGPWMLKRLRAKRRRRLALVAATSVAVAAIVASGLWYSGVFTPPPTVAVFPFEYTGDDPDFERLGTIVADGLITKFQQSRGVRVVPLATVQGLGEIGTISENARLLSADWLISGEVTVVETGFRFAFDLTSGDATTTRPGIYSGPNLTATLDDLSVELFQLLELAAESSSSLGTLRSPSFAAWDRLAAGIAAEGQWDDTGSLEQAAVYYREALRIDPEMASAHARLAITLFELLREEPDDLELLGEARVRAERAFNRNRDLSESRVAMGMAHLAAGDSTLAEQEFARALELAPGNDAALREIARLYTGLGQLAAAEARYKSAIVVRPNFWGTYYDLGRFYLVNTTDRVAALQNLERAIELRPDGQAGLVATGALFYISGDWGRAADYYDRAAQNDPDNVDVRSNLAFLYYSQSQFERALSTWQEVIQLDPGSAVDQGNVGDALVQLGRADEATPYYEQARALYREDLGTGPNAETEALLSMVVAALGECADAMNLARTALRRQTNADLLRYYALVTSCRCSEMDWAEELALELIDSGGFVRDLQMLPDFAPVRAIPTVERALQQSGSDR